MISVEQAYDLLRAELTPLPEQTFPLGDALGLALAEPISSEVDSPPFDKSVVDGYAIDANDPSPTRRVIELITAGATPSKPLGPGQTARVMTGAPLPERAQTVVKWEDCTTIEQDGAELVTLPQPLPAAGSCVMQRGASFARDQEVLSAGRRLTPLDIALLAEIGRTELRAVPRPSVAILPTGDELVAAGEPLAAGQIRNSNGPMLAALLAAGRFPYTELSIARDNVDDLRAKILAGIESDVLLLTGGVSAGVLDLAPALFAELAVREVFHKVRMKPGKPVWFGVSQREENRTLVFGLPGNPVSAFASYLLFALPALKALAGQPFAPPESTLGVLAQPCTHRGKRQSFLPCQLEQSAGDPRTRVTPLPWRGSADLASLTRAQGFAVFPPGDYERAAGEPVEVLLFE